MKKMIALCMAMLMSLALLAGCASAALYRRIALDACAQRVVVFVAEE